MKKGITRTKKQKHMRFILDFKKKTYMFFSNIDQKTQIDSVHL
jgi:hypothetical protein